MKNSATEISRCRVAISAADRPRFAAEVAGTSFFGDCPCVAAGATGVRDSVSARRFFIPVEGSCLELFFTFLVCFASPEDFFALERGEPVERLAVRFFFPFFGLLAFFPRLTTFILDLAQLPDH
ncbi:MAG: hypothetical protein D6679_00295 [Candidatus Hydrogenedentota bacterium]|nr:MAG: hypothetical protein D6679_00295 [Candidatus Hydrogenedentota bacterium]